MKDELISYYTERQVKSSKAVVAFIFVVSVRIEKFLHLKRYRYFPPENQKREEVYINMRKFILKFKKKKKNISLSSNPMYGYKKSQLIVPPFNQEVLISTH